MNLKKITPVIYECAEEEERSMSKSASKLNQSVKNLKISTMINNQNSINDTQNKSERSGIKKNIPKSQPIVPEIITTTGGTNITNYDLIKLKGGKDQTNIVVDTSCSDKDEDDNLKLITYDEAYQAFLTSDFYDEKAREYQLKKEKSKTCMASCCSCLIGKLSPSLEKEKNIMVCLQNKKYIDTNIENDEIEYKILVTLYNFYTKEKKCPKIGDHWVRIGFQTDNPKNDLITVGVFGPLQFLYFTEKYSIFSIDLYRFLVKQKCDWVYAKTMFDISKIVMNLLYTSALDFEFNRNGKVAYVLNEVYTGMVFYFNQIIRDYCENNSLTLQFIASVIQDIKNKSYSGINDFMHNHIRNGEETP